MAVTKRGSHYLVRVYRGSRVDANGKRQRVYDNATFAKRQDALAYERDILSGRTPGQPYGGQSLEEYLTFWMRSYVLPHREVQTQRGYRSYINRHILPTLGRVTLEKLTPGQVQALYTERLEAGLSTTTVQGIHRVLHAALQQAVNLELIPRNVTDKVEAPKVAPYEAATLDMGQLQALTAKAAGTALYGPVLLAAWGGLRAGEVCGVRWSDLDRERGLLTVSRSVADGSKGTTFKTPKSGQPRVVDLPAVALAGLHEWRKQVLERRMAAGQKWQENDLICPCLSTGRPSRVSSLSTAFYEWYKITGLPRCTFHGLRHSHATILAESGVSLMDVSRRLGHSSPSFTARVYLKSFDAAREHGTASLLDQLLESGTQVAHNGGSSGSD